MNPAKALLVQSSLHVLASVCAMGSGSVAHVQLPVCHKQTNEGTCTKHQRVIEDTLFKAKLCLANKMALLYDRPEDYRGPVAGFSQQAIAAVHNTFAQTSAFNACAAVSTGRIGPVALVKTSDFIDVDENVRPGPAERVEQKLSSSQCVEVHLTLTVWFFICSEPRHVSSEHFLGCSHPSARKGAAVHAAIIDAYLAGLDIQKDKDTILWFDILPNRRLFG